ncbi:MAG TPA: beta-glucosidase, partial [Verrucomicrobiae bacterium]|nr:beta-glucosidase [Verrucomicrobiae bacterium]
MFKSFFAAGFECSTHLRRSGWRLDLIAATAHDKFAGPDYARLTQEGIRVTREGVRWHLVEDKPGHYDFSSVLPIVRAARATQTQVIWDLCHFGWPDHLDLFAPEFVSSLASYGAAFVRWLGKELEQVPFIVPVNEISYFSWAAGDEGSMYPFMTGRGVELKRQLVRATLATIRAIRAAAPGARFVQVDPIIHVVASPKHPEEAAEAEAYRESQYQAFDMLCGRQSPELGGADEFLDVL